MAGAAAVRGGVDRRPQDGGLAAIDGLQRIAADLGEKCVRLNFRWHRPALEVKGCEVSQRPRRASSTRSAPQNAALSERISGRLYIGRLTFLGRLILAATSIQALNMDPARALANLRLTRPSREPLHRRCGRDCQIICVRDFREGGLRFVVSIEIEASEGMVSQFAWLQRAVKPQGRVAACRRRGA